MAGREESVKNPKREMREEGVENNEACDRDTERAAEKRV